MISGAFAGLTGFYYVTRYIAVGPGHDLPAPTFGLHSMAFGAAFLFVVIGLANFWVGWLLFDSDVTDTLIRHPFTNAQIAQMTISAISSLTILAVTLFTAWQRVIK